MVCAVREFSTAVGGLWWLFGPHKQDRHCLTQDSRITRDSTGFMLLWARSDTELAEPTSYSYMEQRDRVALYHRW